MDYEIKNALITSTILGPEDHGIFTAYISLKYGDGSGQAFGGYELDEWNESYGKRIGTAKGMEFIKSVLRVLEVESWETLSGTYCRVQSTHSKVELIGHLLKDQWFDPSKLLK